jgi:chromate transport protein ChrA
MSGSIPEQSQEIQRRAPKASSLEVLLVFLRLGFTSFGGPVAHLGYFRAEFVERRRWLDEAGYADIVALCQFLPGPASSQVAVTLGALRAGLPGALAAWLGFTAPSAIALIGFGYGVGALGDISRVAWLHGLRIVAVAVVAQAVWGMARTLCPDRERASVAVGATLLALFVPSAAGQIGAIATAAAIGWLRFYPKTVNLSSPLVVDISRLLAVASLCLFFVVLFALPFLLVRTGDHALALVNSFYRSGALGFWWRSCGAAAAATSRRTAEMDQQRRFSRRVWSGASSARPAFHVFGVFRHSDETSTQRLGGRPHLPRRDLSAVLFAADRHSAVLGQVAAAHRHSCRSHWCERCRCGLAPRRLLHAGLD